jgi:hypothetical protein
MTTNVAILAAHVIGASAATCDTYHIKTYREKPIQIPTIRKHNYPFYHSVGKRQNKKAVYRKL